MPGSSGSRFDRRFSLAEVLIAVALDALLAAAILERTPPRSWQATPYVFMTLIVFSYLVVPFVIIPLYLATRGSESAALRRWHSRRNDLLFKLDAAFMLPLLLRSCTQPVTSHGGDLIQSLVIPFAAIGFTLFLVYCQTTAWLVRNRPAAGGPSTPAGAQAANGVDSANLTPDEAPRHD